MVLNLKVIFQLDKHKSYIPFLRFAFYVYCQLISSFLGLSDAECLQRATHLPQEQDDVEEEKMLKMAIAMSLAQEDDEVDEHVIEEEEMLKIAMAMSLSQEDNNVKQK